MASNVPKLWSALFVIGVQLISTAAGWAQGRLQAGAFSQYTAPDARSRGMGEAFTAIAEGPAAAYWNPGALGFGKTSSTLDLSPFTQHQLLFGASLYSANAVVQQHGFGFGGNLNYLNYGASNFYPENTPESTEYTINAGIGANLSNMLGLAWRAMPLRSGRYEMDVDAGLGVALKVFHVNFAPGTILPSSRVKGTSADLDVGTLWVARVRPANSRNVHPGYVGLRFGGVVSNLLDRDLEYGETNSDPLGRSFRFGLACEAASAGHSKRGHMAEFRVALDVDGFFGKVDSKPGYYYGAELEMLNLVSTRLGHIDDGSFDNTVVGFGIGFEFPNRGGARFDVATVPVLSSNIYTVSGWTTF